LAAAGFLAGTLSAAQLQQWISSGATIWGTPTINWASWINTAQKGTQYVHYNGSGPGIPNNVTPTTTNTSTCTGTNYITITGNTTSNNSGGTTNNNGNNGTTNNNNGTTTTSSNTPVCPPKPRFKICGETKAVGEGDTFSINGESISLSGATDINVIAQEIAAAVDSVNVYVTKDPTTGESCMIVRNKVDDPMVIRNGCAGGVYKEVLDYTLRKDQQVCFNKDVVTSETNTSYTNDTNGNPTSSRTTFVTNTITAESNLQADKKTSVCIMGGTGYEPGDVLRVMGGIPVVSEGIGGVEKISVKNNGAGYEIDSLRIIIGSPGQPGSGAVVDYANIELTQNGGIKSIPLLDKGFGYSTDNPPQVIIRGTGTGAYGFAKVYREKPYVEKVARFIVDDVDENGSIRKINVMNRGLYKVFPSDLDSGVPLQYDIERPQ